MEYRTMSERDAAFAVGKFIVTFIVAKILLFAAIRSLSKAVR